MDIIKTEKKPLTARKKRSNFLALLLIAGSIVVMVMTCGDDQTNNQAATAEPTKFRKDSAELSGYLHSNINLRESMKLEVAEFTAQNCRIRITVAGEDGKSVAEVIGTGACTLAARWLAGKGYTVGHEGIYTTCYVHSPHRGTLGKSDMVVSWGSARYNSNKDIVEWKWDNN